jgi:hypothetical protein
MEKFDQYMRLKDIYSAPLNNVVFKTIPPLNYLLIDGEGDPNTSQFYKDAVQALYSVAYSIKFAYKKGSISIDFKVMPLEGLWWADDMNKFSADKKKDWKWTMMILQPEFVTFETVKTTIKTVIEKKGLQIANQVRLDTLREGEVMQLLHKGPYSAETENIQKLHDTIRMNGFVRVGKHHEIYLNTPLKTVAENLKTIIRQPYKRE